MRIRAIGSVAAVASLFFGGCQTGLTKVEPDKSGGPADALPHERASIDQRPAESELPANVFMRGLVADLGVGVRLDHRRALPLLRAAAEQNVPEARLYLAWKYRSGFGLRAPDPDEAMRWAEHAPKLSLEQSTLREWLQPVEHELVPDFRRILMLLLAQGQAGDVTAQANLARIYLSTNWTAPDPNQYLYWLRRAAANGDAECQRALEDFTSADELVFNPDDVRLFQTTATTKSVGEALYDLGLSHPEDRARVRWLRNAAELDYEPALLELASCYRFGITGAVPQDPKETMRWLERAAALGGADALARLGDEYFLGEIVERDARKAFELHLAAAKQGHVKSQTIVGWAHIEGKLVPTDYSEALRWYEMAALSGDVAAMKQTSVFYRQGKGVKQDWAKGFEWLEKAARKGDVDSQIELAGMLLHGVGIDKDEAEAVDWFQLAADAGDPRGHANLMVLFANGIGVPRDQVRAFNHYLAVAEKTPDEQEQIVSVAGRLTPAERRAAREHVQTWAHHSQLMRAEGNLPELLLLLFESDLPELADSSAAGRLLEQMKTSGRAQCRLRLGWHAFAGKNTPVDLELARRSAKAAAETKPYESALLVAIIDSFNGADETIRAASFSALRKMADEGRSSAALCIAGRLLGGIGVEPDQKLAIHYFDVVKREDPAKTPWIDSLLGLAKTSERPSEAELDSRVSRAATQTDGAPTLIYKCVPIFPPELRVMQVEGRAQITFTVGTDGRPTKFSCESCSHPLFRMAAESALLRWRFTPGRKAGEVVPWTYTQPFNFQNK